MQGNEFRGLAEAVTSSYGADPWFFLRELAQNSRDAGARNIWVDARKSPPGTETLIFADDGRGMTLAHARCFLFRLYASDKDADHAAAGRFGIGFWTILRFQASVIHLQSRRGRHSWAVTLDSDLNARPASCSLDRSGTVVTLSRPAAAAVAGEFADQVEKGLRTYCRYLRRNDRRGSMLPLWFGGRNLTESMVLPGPLSLSFRSGPVEGAVGVGEKPQIRLYARGLPVWQGTVLSQMSHLQADADLQSEIGRGLAPVFLLNGNHLDVTFSRDQAMENKALGLVRKKAEAALRRLLALSLERAFPERWQRRILDRLQGFARRLRRPGWLWLPLILLVLVPLEFVALRHCFPARPEGAPFWFGRSAAPLSYRGASVGASRADAIPPFTYRPGKPAWFRLFTADAFDDRRGFIRGEDDGRRRLEAASACLEAESLEMRLQTDAGGEIFMPLAPGHALVSGSLRINGRPVRSVFASAQGEAIAVVPAGGGTLEYRSCPLEKNRELTATEIKLFTRLPEGLRLPPSVEAPIRGSLSAPIPARAALAFALAREQLAYDASPAVSSRYQEEVRAGAPWLGSVLRMRRGDCDVINGFHVLLLRRMGIPSRLVIGMVGDQGRARPLLHAWSEYYDHGWVVSDASSAAVGAAPGAAEDRPQDVPDAGLGQDGSWLIKKGAAPFLLLLVVAASGALLYLVGRKQRGDMSQPPAEAMKGPLMRLVQHALLQPSAWGTDNPLWRHRFLPVIGGDAVSIEQAKRLQRREMLFMTANLNTLALAMAASNITVLDLSQPLHAPLRTLLPEAIDADRLCRLRPESPARGNSLLASVNAQLRGRRRRATPCLLAPGLGDVDLLSVSLPLPLRDAPFHFPQRFIAVSPAGKFFMHCTALHQRNPALAVVRFLRRLHEEGLLAGDTAPALLRRTARRLLRSAHG